MWSQPAVWIVAAVACIAPPSTPGHVMQITPRRSGLRITQTARVVPGTYELIDPDDTGAITIVGDGLTVDFQGAILSGSPAGTQADNFVGCGIVVRGRNVTVKNAEVRGFKIGIFAEDSPGLTISGCDVSRNYRQRLKSTVAREDLSDWLYGHENDENQWLRYGAGIYLFRCPDATVITCRARNGQNGLCISRCDRARIVDNDMSFMSGWGLAMWRSSQCEVFNNKFDWCMRGYSHGVYSRGQDSTGILVYEQCHDNVFAYNSATHGGDGFFLYAGNETLRKTGAGGCNHNIVYRNDFSHAAANGIEATFSDGNIFVENSLDECTHGVWAGYSYNTIIEANTIRRCTNGVSIEHGLNNRVAGNVIADTKLGVHLWWDDDKDLLASAFGKVHDRCPSSNNAVIANRFERVKTAVRLAHDTNSRVLSNTTSGVDASVELRGKHDGLRLSLTEAQRATIKHEGDGPVSFEAPECPVAIWKSVDVVAKEPRVVTKRGRQDAFLPKGARRGREFIFVDEWGPYDFTDVRVFPSRILGGPRATIQLLGWESIFRIAGITGRVKAAPTQGPLPAKVTLEATEPGVHAFTVDIKVGNRTHRASGTLLNTEWHVAFYGWSESNDPREDDDAWSRIIEAGPLDEITVRDVDFMWYWGAPSDKVPRNRFATVATTGLNLPAGTWRIQTISDDGIRVYVDDREAINNWTWHGATRDEALVKLEDGEHAIRVEHFEIDGAAQLQFRLEPVR